MSVNTFVIEVSWDLSSAAVGKHITYGRLNTSIVKDGYHPMSGMRVHVVDGDGLPTYCSTPFVWQGALVVSTLDLKVV